MSRAFFVVGFYLGVFKISRRGGGKVCACVWPRDETYCGGVFRAGMQPRRERFCIVASEVRHIMEGIFILFFPVSLLLLFLFVCFVFISYNSDAIVFRLLIELLLLMLNLSVYRSIDLVDASVSMREKGGKVPAGLPIGRLFLKGIVLVGRHNSQFADWSTLSEWNGFDWSTKRSRVPTGQLFLKETVLVGHKNVAGCRLVSSF